MATNNQLSGHPVYTLLWPHFEGTLFINNAAQAKLVAPGGLVNPKAATFVDPTLGMPRRWLPSSPGPQMCKLCRAAVGEVE